ncbi:ATP-binding protein, putative [Medicago truncatula]|uniref:ATP-binding protein, putative n=1 Tax=Medicago truncatula TaxID=3880 RepID=A0A072UEU5_MEDTR|nr:ATP-binding protein, putative [Medicago truncatula]
MQSALWQRNHQLENFRSSSFRDDELALFHQMKNCEIENDDLLLRDSTEEFVDSPFDLNPKDSHLFNISSSTEAPVRRTGAADDFLNSETDKNDYEWLLTPPGTPLFPSLEMETKKTVMSRLGASTTRPTELKSRLANPPSEHSRRSNLVSKQQASFPGLTSSGGTRRPLSSGNPGSRPATPTGRPTLSTSSKSSRPSTPTSRTSIASARTMVTTPTSRTSIPSSRTMVTTPPSRTSIPSNRTTAAAAKPVVSSTKTTIPVSKTTTVPAAKPTPTVPSRSSTPLLRSTTRSSTPTSRPTLSTSRPASRASTPTRRPSTPLNAPSISAPSVKTSSISKPAPAVSKQPVPSRGTSPARSRPWKPSEMPGFSLDAPPNLRTTLPERPVSATRGRPGAGAPSARSSSIEPASSVRPKRQSCSPSRGRPANGISHTSGSSMPAVNRGYSKVNDKVSPVAMGNKMVERLINMRKLAPPRPDVKSSPHSNLSGKSSSSPDNSGFGRTLSKKSLDMALRHMDIRKSVPGNLRPLMTNIPASSMYSVRSGHQRSLMVSVSGSPHATSSNAGSEVSVNQNGLYSDNSEIDYYDMVSDRGGQSPASVRGRKKH